MADFGKLSQPTHPSDTWGRFVLNSIFSDDYWDGWRTDKAKDDIVRTFGKSSTRWRTPIDTPAMCVMVHSGGATVIYVHVSVMKTLFELK